MVQPIITSEKELQSVDNENQSSTCEGQKHRRRVKVKATKSFVAEQVEGNEVVPQINNPPRVPDKGIRCAGRNRTSRLLWLHEYFRIYERAHSKNKIRIYTRHCNSWWAVSCRKELSKK